MDIYQSWLSPSAYYAVHLWLWIGPIILLQWIFFHRILRPHVWPLFWVTFLLGSYLIATDIYAIDQGIWGFSANRITGHTLLGVPWEECCFFYLTVLLVCQSFVLFLPQHLRRPLADPKLRDSDKQP